MNDTGAAVPDPQLADAAEVLFRQVHPNLMDKGLPGWTAFRPGPKDEGELSVDRSSITSAEASFLLHTEGKGRQSGGAWGISVGDCENQHLPCRADPIAASEDGPQNDAHAVVVFGERDKAELKKLALSLVEAAITRGQLHPRS